jgi:hypothetical protein
MHENPAFELPGGAAMYGLNYLAVSCEPPELGGYDLRKKLLTAFSKPKRKPGRPQIIPDETLRRSRDELQFVLEQNWALIGWELQQAENCSDIRAAFRRIEGIFCLRLEPFRLEYRHESTFPQMRTSCQRLQNAMRKLNEARSKWEKCKEANELAQAALKQVNNTPKSEDLSTICMETETAYECAHTTLIQLRDQVSQLEIVVQRHVASFAQSQLLDFIRSDRYASSPLNFANAMAGLPAVHWRQSMNRCLSFKYHAGHGIAYQQFRIVEAVFKGAKVSEGQAIDLMKMRLLRANARDVAPCNELAKNWYFLRCAIQSVFRIKDTPEAALSFRIFAEFQRRFHDQSTLDKLRAEQEIITTPQYLKERKRIATSR